MRVRTNPIKAIKDRLEARRQRRADSVWRDALSRGYGWAWTAWRIERKTPLEIESYLSMPIDRSLNSEGFDHGAELALHDIRQIEQMRSQASALLDDDRWKVAQ